MPGCPQYAAPAIISGMRTIITAEQLWDGTRLLSNPVVAIEDGRIASVSTRIAGDLPA